MPKELTHWYVARKVITHTASPRLKKLLREYRDVFLLGAVLPDAPFNCLGGEKAEYMQERGFALHAPEKHSLLWLSEWLESEPEHNQGELALALGMMTHLLTDAVLHPWVFYLSNITQNIGPEAAARHNALETSLDLYLLKQDDNPDVELLAPLLRNAKRALPNLEKLVGELLGIEDPGRRHIRQMLRSHSRHQRLFRRRWFRFLIQSVNAVPGISAESYLELFYPFFRRHRPPLFQEALQYRHPVNGEEREVTVEALIEEAVQTVEERLAAFEEGRLAEQIASLPGISPVSGLEGQGFDDMQYFTDLDYDSLRRLAYNL